MRVGSILNSYRWICAPEATDTWVAISSVCRVGQRMELTKHELQCRELRCTLARMGKGSPQGLQVWEYPRNRKSSGTQLYHLGLVACLRPSGKVQAHSSSDNFSTSFPSSLPYWRYESDSSSVHAGQSPYHWATFPSLYHVWKVPVFTLQGWF